MENIIDPPPNQFTHELTQDEPYYFDGLQQQRPPDGNFYSGTKILLRKKNEHRIFTRSC